MPKNRGRNTIREAPLLVAINMQTRSKAEQQGSQTQFRIGIVEALGFPDQSMDVVLCTLEFHHLPDDH